MDISLSDFGTWLLRSHSLDLWESDSSDELDSELENKELLIDSSHGRFQNLRTRNLSCGKCV